MLNLRFWYIWHYPEDYDPDWMTAFRPGISLALERLSLYTGTSWSYNFGKSFRTTQPIGHGQSVSLDIDAVWEAVRELAERDPDFQWQYRTCDLPIFVFANTREAFVVDYYSPVYVSDEWLIREAARRDLIVVEHEIAHTFGLPDHMKPFAKPEYNDCIMGNVYLGEVRFCSECRPKFIRSNYRKTYYEWIVGRIKEINLSLGDAYAYWAGLPAPQKIIPPITWPAHTEIYTTWQIRIDGNTVVSVDIEFFDVISNIATIKPGYVGEVALTIPPLQPGLQQTEFIVRLDGAVFGSEPVKVHPQAMSVYKTIPVSEVIREPVTINIQEGYEPPEELNLMPIIIGSLIFSGLAALVGISLGKSR